MKRLSLLLVMIFMVCMSWATIDEYYTFNATTGTYTPITGTTIADCASDDELSAAIPIGFTFTYGDNTYSEVKVSSNGWVGLGAGQTGSNLSNALPSTTVVPVLAPLWDDTSMASGTASYFMEGTAPNRIFTIQYSNLQWNYGGPVGYNMQVKLYESGKIAFVYGANGGAPNNPSASIGINMLPGGPGWFYSVTPGTPATASTTTAFNTIAEFPASGTIYEFVPVTPEANDLSALSVTGNTTPTAGQQATYTVTVRNRGTSTQNTYAVKLVNAAGTELATIAGTTITAGQNLTFDLNWTPSTEGPMVLHGKVVLAGDANPDNDMSPGLNIAVQPAGVQAVTIGEGTETARYPMDFFWKNSLYQTLYYPDELGFVSGTITSIQFYNNFVTDLPNGATKIWMGVTAQQDLSAGYIPSTDLTLVFDGNVQYPAGANTITIPLTTPFMYTPGNLVVMVNRPMDTQYYSSSDYFQCQTGTQANRARYAQSDSNTYDPAAPPAGTATAQFPKTTLFYSGQAIDNDLGALSIAGNITPSVGAPTDYTVTIKNNGTITQSNYTVKLMQQGGVELASVPGTAIESMQTLPFTLTWTPSATGPTAVYGKVVMTGDEIAQNNETTHLNVNVQAAGIVAVTVGNGGSTGRMPVDMFYMNSLFETVYLSSELNIGGLLTGIQFYNSFQTDLPNMPVNIWVGETTQGDLSADWIPSTQLTQVFNGTVNFPSGQNEILITLTNPYPYGGGNLVVMVERPMDTDYYSSSDVFVTQTGTVPARTRNLYSDSTDYDPAAPPTATPAAVFPKTTFMFITEGMGALTGTVYGPGNVPLAGATVDVLDSNLITTTNANGQFNFAYIAEGAWTVTATKHGYTVDTQNVTIVEDQTTTQNFTIALLPQVTVTGRVVGSDQPTVGLAGATISLTGYEPYEATTGADGTFTIPNVFANQTYDYQVVYPGYQQATGEVVVGGTNVNMGDITVNEIALPATQVVATEAADFSNVEVTWGEPGTAGGEWLSYCGENNDSIGTGGVADFDVAIRFPASALADYAGMSLYSVKLWPAQAGTFSLRVWTGGNASAPAQMVVDQPFTAVLDQYNEIALDNPVAITGTEELWFGMRCNVTSGYPAGCDAGPQVEGFGNMMYWQNAWTTLSLLAPTLTYNWNIEGYVGFSGPTRGPELIPLTFNADRMNTGELATLGSTGTRNLSSNSKPEVSNRVLTGYKVYRLLQGEEDTPNEWDTLTPTSITALNYTDNAWAPLPSGVYRYAVRAVYTNNVMAPPAFSNVIHKGMMGTLTGTVTDLGTGTPIEGATIVAGEYSGTSNASGEFSFGVYQGIYTVNCSAPGYQAASQPAVNITGLQTTTVDFALAEIALPPTQVVSEQVSNNTIVNVTWMSPDPNAVDLTEGFEGDAFPPEEWSQVITDTGAPGTTGVYPTWCRVGDIALTPVVVPPEGQWQAAMWWSYNHQDEWLITPEFTCPPAAALNFMSYVYFGSTNGDHYNVKVSTDGGNTWTNLWDASTLTGGWNYYDTPINIDLSSYAGQMIKIAWHAEDPPSNDGMWYTWFLDQIEIGSATRTITFKTDELVSVSNGRDMTVVSTGSAPISRAAMSKSAEYRPEPRVESTYSYNPPRALVGYKAWRLLQGQEANEAAWTSLTPNTITATGLQDMGWADVPDGTYKWAVKAVYTGNVMSLPAFSNTQTKLTQVGTIAGLVRNPSNQGISGATVVCGDVSTTTNASGAYVMTVGAGTVSVTASAPGYQDVTQSNVVVVTGQTTTVNFQLPISEIALEDGFESYANFVIDFAPWTLVDVDMSGTYGMTGITWDNAYDPQAYIIFNPSATTPAITDLEAHGGDKMAACFASTTPPNDDWMITPLVPGGGYVKFWAKSYTADYGLERFKVGVSDGSTNPAQFTIISGANYVSAPVEWTEYEFDTTAYAGQQIRIGIQCLSNDAFIFLVDDVEIAGSTAGDDPTVPVVTTQLAGNYPNPFNPETTISYSVETDGPVTIDIYNTRGQLVKRLVNEAKAAGNHTVVWNGRDSNGSSVSSGLYYYKMTAGKYSSTRKMILMK